MKPTRKDLVGVLKKRMLAKVQSQIDTIRKSLEELPHPHDFHDELREKAKSIFRKKHAKFIASLTRAGIKHTVESHMVSGHSLSTSGVFCVYVSVNNLPKAQFAVHPTKAQVATMQRQERLRQSLSADRIALERQIRDLEDSNSVVEDTISEMLLNGDDELSKLVEAIEAKLTKTLEQPDGLESQT